MGEVQPFEVARTGPREGGGAPVYGPVLGTTATPEAVGGLGRRVWLLRTARAQRAREAPPWGRGGGSFRTAVRTAVQIERTLDRPSCFRGSQDTESNLLYILTRGPVIPWPKMFQEWTIKWGENDQSVYTNILIFRERGPGTGDIFPDIFL